MAMGDAIDTVDMGCYEYMADCNGNGVVDSEDIANCDGGVWCADYNLNGVPDGCETIYNGPSYWNEPSGGFFSLWSSWDNQRTPGPDSDVYFNLDAAYTVEFTLDVQNESLNVGAGEIIFDLGYGAYHLLSAIKRAEPAIIVGDSDGDDAALTIMNGEITGAMGRIGHAPGSKGELTVSGVDGQLRLTESLIVGNNGDGALNIMDGAYASCRNVDVGKESGSWGEVLVKGQDSLWNVPFFITIDRGVVTVAESATLHTTYGGVVIYNNGILRGDGFIDGDVLNFGMLSMGDPADNGIGTLSIDGDFIQVGVESELGSSSGTLALDITGSAPGVDYDQLIVNRHRGTRRRTRHRVAPRLRTRLRRAVRLAGCLVRDGIIRRRLHARP